MQVKRFIIIHKWENFYRYTLTASHSTFHKNEKVVHKFSLVYRFLKLRYNKGDI